MKHIPETKNALVLRTDFSDAASWESICAAIREPVGEFRAYVDFVSDPAYDGIPTEQLLSLMPPGSNHTFIFIADRLALSQPDHPILVVDLYTEPGRTLKGPPVNVIDSSGWLEYLADGPNADFFAAPIEATVDLLVPMRSFYEVFKRVMQQRGEDDALQAVVECYD